MNFAGGQQPTVVFGQLVHTQNGDDVLQLFVALEHRLNRTSHGVVLVANDVRGQMVLVESGVNGWVNTKLGNRTANRGGVKWANAVAGAGSVKSSAGT